MYSLNHILALNALPGITSAIVRRLVESNISLDEISTTPPEGLAGLGLRRGAITAAPELPRYLEAAEAQSGLAARLGASIIHFWSDDYPTLLRRIYSPPVILHLMGTPPADEHAIAIVGTRTASTYGRLTAEEYAREFTAAGVTVVSGMARGIDTFAHAAALGAGGRTVAVIASGLDAISPFASARFAERIAAHGTVVSEYPFGVKALPPYFPQRNRIISGMTRATVVVESDTSGGAMITAGFAMDQDREVFAVPGPLTSPKSRGTNLLIRTDRARLTQTPVDVLDALGYHIPAGSVARSTGPSIDELTLFERRVYDALDAEPRHVDLLCEATGLAASEILVTLLSLEFKGLARQMAGKLFLRSR